MCIRDSNCRLAQAMRRTWQISRAPNQWTRQNRLPDPIGGRCTPARATARGSGAISAPSPQVR
eukprot:4583108-Alexandrium_andersonii.AAC.1